MAVNPDFEQLRSSFAGKAHAYHQTRPRSSRAFVRSILDYCELDPGARVLEIGCGTGQATQAFLDNGCKVTAVEKAADMAELALETLSVGSGKLTIHTQAFEEFEIGERYDLVFAANALHWIQPELRYSKPLSALEPGGYFAVLWGGVKVWNEHAREVFNGFWRALKGNEYQPGGVLVSLEEDIKERRNELDGSGLYEPAKLFVSEFDRVETPELFVTNLTTWSSLQFLEAPRQLEFLEETYRKLKALGEPLRSVEAELALVARPKSNR